MVGFFLVWLLYIKTYKTLKMAKLNFTKVRKTSGSYENLVGPEIAQLVTTIQAATITQGTEVAMKLINSYEGKLPIFQGSDVNNVQKTLRILKSNPSGVIIFGGRFSKSGKTKTGKRKTGEVDLIILKDGVLYLFEIKNGNQLDTKKSKSEYMSLKESEKYFISVNFITKCGLVLVNTPNGYHSIKDNDLSKLVIVFEKFCKDFGFSKKTFNKLQEEDQEYNINEALKMMSKIVKNHNLVV